METDTYIKAMNRGEQYSCHAFQIFLKEAYDKGFISVDASYYAYKIIAVSKLKAVEEILKNISIPYTVDGISIIISVPYMPTMEPYLHKANIEFNKEMPKSMRIRIEVSNMSCSGRDNRCFIHDYYAQSLCMICLEPDYDCKATRGCGTFSDITTFYAQTEEDIIYVIEEIFSGCFDIMRRCVVTDHRTGRAISTNDIDIMKNHHLYKYFLGETNILPMTYRSQAVVYDYFRWKK